MEKYEEKILEMLKEEGEQLEIPERLSPEKIEKELKKQKTARKSYGKIFAGLAAAACVGMVIWSGYPKMTQEAPQLAAERRSVEPDIPIPKTVEAEVGPDNYDSIYTLLAEAEKRQIYDISMVKQLAESGMEMPKGEAAGKNDSSTAAAGYSETNVRTAGVDEGDILKTDGVWLYALMTSKDGEKKELHILKPENGSVSEVSKIEGFQWGSEFYIQDNLLILMEEKGVNTAIHLYEITDRENPMKLKTLNQSGYYETSRLQDGILYTFSRFYPNLENKNRIEDYVPATEGCLIPLDCIYLPEEVYDSSYLVMTALSLENTGDFCDKKAILSTAGRYYVSQDNIYIFRNEYVETGEQRTGIWRYGYGNGQIHENGSVYLAGYVDDSFSVDEYNGYLRVLTTKQQENSGNALFVLDERLEIAGSITGLAKGERIYSARFMGDTAYFVTFRNIDPLFCVDLSDPEKPEVLGELKVTGVSEYLHFYGENKLLGIGREIAPETGEGEGIKLSMFDISNPLELREEKKLVLTECFYSSAFDDYRTVLINPEKNLIGFLTEEDYHLFSYKETDGFVKRLTVDHASITENMNYQEVRGVYIGEDFYLLQDKTGILVYDLNTNKKTGEWKND
ncbi:MAG: beta-propeller domain-containing protein [Acetivibrio ethanolgignens]